MHHLTALLRLEAEGLMPTIGFAHTLGQWSHERGKSAGKVRPGLRHPATGHVTAASLPPLGCDGRTAISASLALWEDHIKLCAAEPTTEWLLRKWLLP